MIYASEYESPIGKMYLNSDGEYLTALCFAYSRDEKKCVKGSSDLPVFEETKRWLDIYFSKREPDFTPKYRIENITPFRQRVSEIMRKIPYGKTVTYNDIAKEIARERGIGKMSAQAVGGAVGWNPICIIIPCHRVVGAGGNLTGYGGGLKNKVKLLEYEGIDMSRFYLPGKR